MAEQNILLTRLKQTYSYLRDSGKVHTQKELAQAIGWQQTHLSSAMKGDKARLTLALMENIWKAFPFFNLHWLQGADVEMLVEDKSEKKEKSSGRKVPVYDAETTGGAEGLVSSSTETANIVGYVNSGSWFENKETAVIRHVGDSMTEFPDGCWLAVRRVLNPNLLIPGKPYVVETEEFRVTKRIQKGSEKGYIKLYSTNKEKYEDGTLVHEPFEIHLSDVRRIFAVLGYVVNLTGEIQFIN